MQKTYTYLLSESRITLPVAVLFLFTFKMRMVKFMKTINVSNSPNGRAEKVGGAIIERLGTVDLK